VKIINPNDERAIERLLTPTRRDDRAFDRRVQATSTPSARAAIAPCFASRGGSIG
jgi:hypothetical protein